jgi:membrane-associated phospholipid phosphatase
MSDKNQDILSKAAQFISIICHPVFVPLYTVWFYFRVSPKYFLPQNEHFLYLYLFIVSIAIPLLFFGTMLFSKSFSGYQLDKPKERFFFSVIMAVVYVIIFQKLSHYHQFIELYPFFIGVFLSILGLTFYNFFGYKPSIHVMAITGMLTFFVIWSYYSQINILCYISGCFIILTLVAASRIYLEAHSLLDILRGFIIGLSMQLIAFYITWLYF